MQRDGYLHEEDIRVSILLFIYRPDADTWKAARVYRNKSECWSSLDQE
jgi:hypothetical protein